MSELPRIERNGDTWVLAWDEAQVGMGLDRLAESRDGIHAEITVESLKPEKRGRVLGPVRLNLLSGESQTRFANTLDKRVNGLAWHSYVVQACAIVAKQFREPSPTVRLRDVAIGPVEYLVPGLIPLGETTFIYGDSEGGKSLLAARIAISVQTGCALPWGVLPCRTGNVLYLDWETNDRTVASRVLRLSAGIEGLEDEPDLLYRGTVRGRPMRPLEDELPSLREQIDREKIDLVVVDSIGFAIKGSLVEDQPARQAMADLKQLGPATRLVVAHISKESVNKTGRVDPFGSAFFRAGVRSGFEVRRSEEDAAEGEINCGIYHWKSNDGAHVKPFGLRVRFDANNGPIWIDRADLSETPDLAARTSLSSRVRALLKYGEMTTSDLAEELDVKENVLRTTLGRMPDAIQIGHGGGRGNPSRWALEAPLP